MSRRKSSHEVEVGRHGKFCCTKIGASTARTRSVESTRASKCVISSRVEGTIAEVTKDRMSSRNRGTHGSPYASQRAIQKS